MGDNNSDSGGGRSLDALLGEIARAPEVVLPTALLGTMLGRYRVDALLGRGGMGIVYRAFDTKLSREIALKVLPPDLLAESDRRARFVKEARLAASVTHPCTAAVYDVGEEGANVFIAMELVKGRTLRSVLDEHPGGMPALEVARICADVARGLAKAHEGGVIHRDLKPENVMLDDEGQVKVLDFGLAKLREVEGEQRSTASTELGRVMGTPSYMSPEQAKGKRIDARSDLFSLGIVLYEMLSGKRPFVGETTMEVLIAIDRDPPAPLASVTKGLPHAIVTVVERCLRKEPAERFSNGREVADALRAIAGTGSSSRGALSPVSSGRGGFVWAIGAVAVVVAAAGYGLSRAPGKQVTASDAAPASAPLAAADSILACPILEASGVDAPAGWLGAAAASIACRRAVWMLGGRAARTLAPAELLALPRAPSDEISSDTFGPPEVREKTRTAARARAAAWLDGSVERKSDGFIVRLTLRAPDDAEIARGEGSGRALVHAVAAAMTPLGLPHEKLDPEIVRWSGIADAELALAREDWLMGTTLGSNQGYEVLERRRDALGVAWESIRAQRGRNAGEVLPPSVSPELDRSSPEAFARTAVARGATARDVGATVADELHALLGKETSTVGRISLTRAEATLRYSTGDSARASDLMLGILNDAARNPWAWDYMTANTYGRIGMQALGRGYAAWAPEEPDSWNIVGYSSEPSDIATRTAYGKRAFQLASDMPLYATNYATVLLRLGRRADARAVASRLSTGSDEQKRAGEALLIVIEAAEVRFRAALERARTLFGSMPALGSVEAGSDYAVSPMLEVAALAGQAAPFAEMLVERFILPDPPRLVAGHFAPLVAAGICPRARREIAVKCLARVRGLVESGYFREGLIPPTMPLLDGIDRMFKGDVAGAADRFRPLIGAPGYGTLPFVVDVFERNGDLDTAEKADAMMLTYAGYNGATMAHLRAARRAAKRGDTKRAREMAQKVVDAWGSADLTVDAVREMRELLEKTTPR